jgi:Phosphate-selective porin O and P
MRYKPESVPHRSLAGPLLGLAILAAPVSQALADGPTVSVGAGMRSSFTSIDYDGPGNTVNDFSLDNARLYVSGKVTDQIGFMFNTQYSTAATGDGVDVMDAAAQFSFSDQFNIWAGRFLPPSDRSNLYGPYYADNWAVYVDGVQDGYPSAHTGRADGVMYWGQFGVTKVSAGVFDAPSTIGAKTVLGAARIQVDLWDPEGGYYLNGTYYGDKDLLAFGLAAQTAHSDDAYSADLLLEKKLGGGGVFTVEAEYAKYDGLGGYGGAASSGYYGLLGYVFPGAMGIGKVQVLGKFGTVKLDAVGPDPKVDTLELDVNYLIKPFNARVTLFYLDQESFAKTMGLGLQIQM